MKIINIKQLVSAVILASVSVVAYAGGSDYGHTPHIGHSSYNADYGYSGYEYSGRPYYGHAYSGRPYYGNSYYDSYSELSYYDHYRPRPHGQRIIRSQIHVPGFSLELHL